MDEQGSSAWRFAQCFGDKAEVEDITEGESALVRSPSIACSAGAADIISTVEFDATGNYLATGDKGGRVVLFERNESVRPSSASPSVFVGLICNPRKRAANTSSTPSSSRMNQNSTT